MINLKDCIENVCRKATTYRTHSFAIHTLQSAKPVQMVHKIRVTRSGEISGFPRYTVETVDALDKVIAAIDMKPVYSIAGMISATAFAKTQYGNVSDDVLFRIMYDVTDRQLTYVENGIPTQKTTLSGACMECGLILPLRNLTVDHQRPQSGGEYEAVLKTFRAFELTTEGPQGAKGRMVQAYVRASAQLSPLFPQQLSQLIVPIAPKLGRGALGGASVVNRYTLNEQGAILYSFIVESGNLAEMKSNCMHGLLNLKPLCGACNSARGNPLKF